LLLQQHVANQLLLIYTVLILAIIIIAGLYIRHAKRRRKIRQESEDAIRNSKLKTSQKVHDVVANGLYGVMNELEHSKTIEREPLIDKIEELYEKSRNISYEDDITVANASEEEIPGILASFSNEQTKVIIVGDQRSFWKRMNSLQKHELKLILQEVMINMKKHSHARNVVIQFKQDQKNGSIQYSDDGVGFEPNQHFGNGLNNTVNRIKSLNGEVIFGKSEKGGASIALSLPFESSST
jgi:nitrate/nitrite-specific signal transduction histidine kinase